MDLNEIKELIALMDDASLSEIEVEDSERRIRIRRDLVSPAALVPSVMPARREEIDKPSETLEEKDKAADKHRVTSPIVGTFYTAPSPSANPYVALGDLVKKGQVVCVVEAMKLMNEIESDVDGKIVNICIEDGTAVEYGETLFEIEPA